MNVEIIETHTTDFDGYSITELKITPPYSNIIADRTWFGVDPGTTKLGLAFLWRSVCHIFETKITRDEDAVVRIILMQKIMSLCLHMFDYAPLMVIEGSSYSGFREVELAEIRASAVLWAAEHGVTPRIVPPLTIRKGVFSNGKIKAEEVWSDLPPDAASALACAYYCWKVQGDMK